MKSFELIAGAERSLATAGVDSPKLDAELLLAYALKKSRFDVVLNSHEEIPAEAEKTFLQLVKRRELREPVAYITGKKEFWSFSVKVTKDVLVPRPETEFVVEEALRIANSLKRPVSLLDLCTGSGCIAMAIAGEIADSKIAVSDISGAALSVAKTNLEFASQRISFFNGNLFEPIPDGTRYDIITCNPPYIAISEREKLAPEITDFEPHKALFAEKEGLDLIEKIITTAPKYLVDSGSLIVEFGLGQGSIIRQVADSAGFAGVKLIKDYSGIERVASMRRRGE